MTEDNVVGSHRLAAVSPMYGDEANLMIGMIIEKIFTCFYRTLKLMATMMNVMS